MARVQGSITMQHRLDALKDIRQTIEAHPGCLLSPLDWEAAPNDLNDWASRAVEACVFATTTNILSYRNACVILCEPIQDVQELFPLLPWEYVFITLSSTAFERRKEAASKKVGDVYDSYDSLEKCPKCGSKASWEQKQTRSADEGCTVFWKCSNAGCAKTWRRY